MYRVIYPVIVAWHKSTSVEVLARPDSAVCGFLFVPPYLVMLSSAAFLFEVSQLASDIFF